MAFTSDHGEAFDENHPKSHHGYSLHSVELHVPLIIQGPAQRGATVDGLVSHADLLPTLANLTGYEPRDVWVGESLVPVLFDGAPVEKDVVYSLYYIPEAYKRDEDPFMKIGVRTREYYYFEDLQEGKRRLVRWPEDPLDNHNLTDESGDIAEKLRYLAAKKLEWFRERERAISEETAGK